MGVTAGGDASPLACELLRRIPLPRRGANKGVPAPLADLPGLLLLLDLFEFVMPEQLRAPVLEQHIQGQVVGFAPTLSDRAFLPPQLGL
jgi:hypothetical protein